MKQLSLTLSILLFIGPTLADTPKRKLIRIPATEAPRIIKIGELAGIAQTCGIGWADYYISFYKSERRKGIWTDIQLKNITAIFSFAQAKAVRDTKPCPQSKKKAVQAELSKLTGNYKSKKE